MSSGWRGRVAAGVAAAFAVASGSALLPHPPAQFSALAQSSVAPAASSMAIANTGHKAEGGFLVDFTKGYDKATHYLSDYDMNMDWIQIGYRPANVQFSSSGMTLNLHRTIDEKLPFSGSEFQRIGYYGYGRYEAVLRAAPGEGAVSSFFTYTGEYFDDPHDEIDFEILGASPRHAHLNYFKNGSDNAVDVPLWFDATKDYHLYVFYWTPDSIRWIIDGHIVRVVTAEQAKTGIPTASGHVIANLWAGAGDATKWTGVPRFTRTSATYRCIAHVPLGKSGPRCSDTFRPPPIQ